MKPDSFPHPLDLPEEVQEVLTRYVAQVQQQWNNDIGGLLLYGSTARGDFIPGRSNINILLVVEQHSLDLLQRAAQLHKEWAKHQLVAPLLITNNDIGRMAGLFPLEYFLMTQHHVVLAGQAPFVEVDLNRASLGWQCEQELMANLLRLRQRFIEGEGRIEAIQALLILSITAVLPCLRGLFYCIGQSSKEKDLHILEALPATIQFDPAVLVDVLNMKKGMSSPGSLEWPKTYERYLQSLEGLIVRVQKIREEGQL